MQDISREQGDINLSERRKDYQQQALSQQATDLIQRDKNAFCIRV
ncbi:hypothetical protein JCM19231_2729 [Vibrio ishigakensis]|uniref:Uncharacterized protein n=1 Tax=Vibrio ishigakensis TaxID=1481914 RepID=A0A0B8NU16_9VIBR|nr:hypothetical protein JCM19231_2729 [Vibrio ishigakensis]